MDLTPCQKISIKRLRLILKAGVDILQLRCKNMYGGLFLKYALMLRRLTRSLGVLFIINDRPDIALICGADGLHIGQDDIPVYFARKILGKDKLIGFSTHSLNQAKKAAGTKGIDYIGIGPVFKTQKKPDAKPIGFRIIGSISKKKDMPPFFAIGGIKIENVSKLIKAGAGRIALSSGIFDSKDPQGAVRYFKRILNDTD